MEHVWVNHSIDDQILKYITFFSLFTPFLSTPFSNMAIVKWLLEQADR
jgi:hypothetical protein